MRLTGWTRLAIFLMVLWTIIVAWATWATWPPTYISMDPAAGVPVGADVTPLMDGIVKNNEKLTSAELARRIKGKYPQYNDLTDEQLVEKLVRTYPKYRGCISDLDWFQR